MIRLLIQVLVRVLASVFVLALLASAIPAQSTGPAGASAEAAPPSTPLPAFDVADVHASPHVLYPFMDGPNMESDRFVLHQATMADMIGYAYNLDIVRVQGGPSWLEWDRFDVSAKAPSTTAKATLRLMLKTLLAERFHLVVHDGTAPLPAYVLTAQKDKLKLKESQDPGDPDCEYQPPPPNQPPSAISQIVFACHRETMSRFADDLHDWAGGYLDKIVVDSTGLNGAYDFDIKWTGRGQLAKAGADGISIFDAVDKELGLKLTLETAPRPVLLVDSVDQEPTPNPADLAKRLPPLPPAQFEVAVIKPSKPDTRPMGRVHNGQVDVQSLTLKMILTFAWDLNPNSSEMLAGAPKWIDSDHFDIQAKVATEDDPTDAAPKPPQIDDQELQQMLRALIEDRFQMKDHWEDRPVTAYSLIAVSPKLTRADPKSRTRCQEGPGPDSKDPRLANPVLNRLVHCQNMTMAQLGEQLESIAFGYIYSPVLDKTGLQGSYDFTLSFSSAEHFRGNGGNGAQPADGASPGSAPAASDPNGAISLFDAVKNQLGLKLEKERRPVPVLVIDHVEEQPTAN